MIASRTQDPEVTLRIDVQKETFYEFLHNLQYTGEQRIPLSALCSILGDDIFYRVINEAGDSVWIVESTLSMKLRDKGVLTEFTKDLKKKITHQGYSLVVKFVRKSGKSHEIPLQAI